MKAVLFEEFGGPLKVEDVPEPEFGADDVLVSVKASGICRSDWHGWMGHDPDIRSMPHVPGHELSGVIAETGKNVSNWKPGERITVPFVSGCGSCPECTSGNPQVCDHQSQPGFTHWGSYAERVTVRYAETNLVRLPEGIDFGTAASLGCRFGTSYRAIVAQARVSEGDWVAVHGCGGVGLSAIMIAVALGARIVAVDIDSRALDLAKSIGAEVLIDASQQVNIAEAIHELTGRGAHVSVDALGSAETCVNSISCLRKRGRHVQVGLLVGDHYRPSLPMEKVIARELEIFGSHGIQSTCYGEMFDLIESGRLNPDRLIGMRISLEEAPAALGKMNDNVAAGITVIDRF